MSDHEQLREPDPSQPDQPYNRFDVSTRWIAELIATGEFDPSTSKATGDGSTLPPKLREIVQKWLQEQTNNSTPPPPNTPQ